MIFGFCEVEGKISDFPFYFTKTKNHVKRDLSFLVKNLGRLIILNALALSRAIFPGVLVRDLFSTEHIQVHSQRL